MNFKYYNEIIDKIVALKQQGIGSRQIEKQLNKKLRNKLETRLKN